MSGQRDWNRPASEAERAAVDREKAYWEEHEDLDWVDDASKREVMDRIPSLTGDVLELCIGSGTFTRALPKTYASYTGLDISESLLRTLEVTVPGVVGVLGNAEEPDFPDGSFDAVVTFAGLHHLPRFARSIHESYRLLRPGGIFFCFEPNDLAWYRMPMRLMRRFIDIYSEDETYLDPREVSSVMEEAGFIRLSVDYLTPRFKRGYLDAKHGMFARMMYTAASLGKGARTQSFFSLSGFKPNGS